MIAFVVAARAAGIAVAWFVRREDATAARWWIVVAPAVAAVAAAFVETAPIRLNDNISVPAVAAAVLWATTHVDAAVFVASWPALASRAVPAVAINLLVAVAGWRAGTVTVAGAITGANTPSTGWIGFAPLNFTGPVASATIAALEGNAPENRVAIAATLTVSAGPGQEIWLRWRDTDDGGADHGLAIDDFAVTAHGIPPGDDDAPTVTNTTPANGATVIQWSCGTNVASFAISGLDNAEFNPSGSNGQVTTFSTTDSNNNTGTYNYTVTATHQDGRMSSHDPKIENGT